MIIIFHFNSCFKLQIQLLEILVNILHTSLFKEFLSFLGKKLPFILFIWEFFFEDVQGNDCQVNDLRIFFRSSILCLCYKILNCGILNTSIAEIVQDNALSSFAPISIRKLKGYEIFKRRFRTCVDCLFDCFNIQ